MAKFLDLDSVAADAEFVLKLGGEEHPLKIATVDSFIQNMKELEKLGMNASLADEAELTVKIIMRAFPTLKEEQIRALNIVQMRAIQDFAQQANGEKVEVEEKDAEGNAPAGN